MDTIQNNKFFSSESQKQISSNNSNRNIPYFFLKDYLSDAILKFEQSEIPFHKIIISSASDFFFEYFKTLKNPYEKIEVILPEYIKSSLGTDINKKQILENIFNYCYHNQDIKSIEENITKNNCFNYVEMAHCLQIKSLKENLENIIIKNFLNEDTVIKLCEESVLFEMDEVHKYCKENIIKNLGKIKNIKKEITRLNYDTFKDIISSDEIDVENEKQICDLVIEYIKFIREIPEEIKENINNIDKNVDNLNLEVKKEIKENNENKEQNEENKEINEENKENQIENLENQKNEENNINIEEKKDENLEEKSKEIKENNENNPYNIWKKHLEEIKKKLIKKRLTQEEERDLISCIRLSFLSHSDLMLLNNEPLMDNFKDLIMQGLSARLDTYENAEEKNMIINLKPRNYLRKKENIDNNYINNNKNEFENNINNNNENINQKKIIREENENIEKINKFNDPRNFAYSQQNKINNYNQNFMEEDNSINNKINMNTNPEINKYKNNFQENNENININDINESNSNYLEAEDFNTDYINSMNKKMKNQNQNNNNQFQNQYSPKNNKRTINSISPLIFRYNYDFDENGALYYIGTLGKKYIYRNPHELKLVKAFASSISKGEISDFVGRNLVNLRTENEESSFFGVDLGQNRRLIPSAYSLRNRNSSTHVLLCWELEGSNDKINFEVLDTRIFLSENHDINKKLENERNLLIQPGCTSTWGISKKIREQFPEGFRYFIIKQINKNSNGSYNLTNSGFEIYGEAIGDGWFFD